MSAEALMYYISELLSSALPAVRQYCIHNNIVKWILMTIDISVRVHYSAERF
jgi:hypothetical protein